MPRRSIPHGFENVATEKIVFLMREFYCSYNQIIRWREELGLSARSYRNSRREIAQFLPTGEFVRKYKSIADAARKNQVKEQNIWKCLHGTAKTTGGYVWKYADERTN